MNYDKGNSNSPRIWGKFEAESSSERRSKGWSFTSIMAFGSKERMIEGIKTSGYASIY